MYIYVGGLSSTHICPCIWLKERVQGAGGMAWPGGHLILPEVTVGTQHPNTFSLGLCLLSLPLRFLSCPCTVHLLLVGVLSVSSRMNRVKNV